MPLVGAVIQARMGSTRLPGKASLAISDEHSLLSYLISRLRQAKRLDKIIVATTEKIEDDRIEAIAISVGADVFRGSEEDVLDRYKKTSDYFELDTLVRIPSDNPFTSPVLVDEMLSVWSEAKGFDYLSNILKPTYPLGMHVEIIDAPALQVAWMESTRVDDREHVTPYIYNNPKKFALRSYESESDLSDIRLTIDYEEDLIFARKLAKYLDKRGDTYDVKSLCDIINANPGLLKINQHHKKPQAIFR